MCGIFCLMGVACDVETVRPRAVALSSRLRHRGPDWTGVHIQGSNILCHERLAIVGLDNGAQPIISRDGKTALCVNGEVYNHKEIRASLPEVDFITESDCEPVMHLFLKYGTEFLEKLDGDYAFVVSSGGKDYLAARDPMGVCPLYYGKHKDGSIWFASEMKCLHDDCESIDEFPPGHYYTPATGFVRWHKRSWQELEQPAAPIGGKTGLTKVRDALEAAVSKRLMCDVPYGVLLSGGLDSSLVSSIAARHARKRVEDNEQSEAWYPRLHSFAIGLEGAPDLKAAKEVADYLGTVHHTMHFTVEDGIDALPSVIYHLETCDITTIRASTPMFLLSRKIKAMGVKMVLSGEGADELYGGYLYFHNAPDAEEFHRETCRRTKALHKFDVLRANKSTQAWGLEVRVPFLDKDFIDASLSVAPEERMCGDKIEKHFLRSAFDDKENPYLPEKLLWRQKEQFSDGVGYSWIDGLKEYAERRITDEEMSQAAKTYPQDTPATKEGYLYRQIFETKYPQSMCRSTVNHWVPKWGSSSDPSGRAQKVHDAAYNDGDVPKAKKSRRS